MLSWRVVFPTFVLSLLMVQTVLSSQAWAARKGRVDATQASVYETADENSVVIEKLNKGAPIAASNLPVKDFFKVRTVSNKIGWMKESDLALEPAPGKLEGTKTRASNTHGYKPLPHSADDDDDDEMNKYRFRVRGFGGLNFFQASGIVVSYDQINQGVSAGGEIVVRVASKLGLVVRVEKISKNLSFNNAADGKTYTVSLSSLPVFGGLEWTAYSHPRFSIHLSGLVGYTLPTQLTSSVATDTANTGFNGTSKHLTFLGKVDAHLNVYKTLSVFLEGGYRISKSPDLNVASLSTSSTTGTTILQPNFNMNLSGLVLAGGLSVQF